MPKRVGVSTRLHTFGVLYVRDLIVFLACKLNPLRCAPAPCAGLEPFYSHAHAYPWRAPYLPFPARPYDKSAGKATKMFYRITSKGGDR